jgi:hypothetical protein
MKVKLRIHKDGAALSEGTYLVVDADSFGRACTDVWTQFETGGWPPQPASARFSTSSTND